MTGKDEVRPDQERTTKPQLAEPMLAVSFDLSTRYHRAHAFENVDGMLWQRNAEHRNLRCRVCRKSHNVVTGKCGCESL